MKSSSFTTVFDACVLYPAVDDRSSTVGAFSDSGTMGDPEAQKSPNGTASQHPHRLAHHPGTSHHSVATPA